jgi:hypothetical protein
VHEQQRQQAPLTPAADLHRAPVLVGLQRPEYTEPHSGPTLRPLQGFCKRGAGRLRHVNHRPARRTLHEGTHTARTHKLAGGARCSCAGRGRCKAGRHRPTAAGLGLVD